MSIFWLNDPTVLFQEIPDKFTFIDKLNFIFLGGVVLSIILVLLLIKIVFCGIGGLIVTYIHSKFSYKWLRNNFNICLYQNIPMAM